MAHEDARTPTDEELVRAARAGDLDAFGGIVERYQAVAFRAAYLVTRDAAAAEDVCQEGFLRAHRALHRLRAGEPLRPWLLRIVTNLARNELRSRRRRLGLVTRLGRATPGVASGPERALEEAERSARVLAVMQRLPIADREVLYLRHFVDLPEAEIATAIGKRRGTVKSRLSRAHARLRDVIAAQDPELLADVTRGEAADD